MKDQVCPKCRWLLAMHKAGGKCLPKAKPVQQKPGTPTA